MTSDVTVRLDRVQIVSSALPGDSPPKTLRGFKRTRDCFVRRQTTTSTYARARHYRSLANGTRIYWQYRRLKSWLMPWKVTIVSDDLSGLSRDEIERVLNYCRFHRLLLVEVAIDFSPSTGVNRRFIRSHAVFGKSHRDPREGISDLYYGSRKSDKLVRCYEKPEVGAYRVELELHSGFLGRNSISQLDDLVRIPVLVCPKHFQLVDLDWNQLRRHLEKKIGDRSDSIIAAAQRRTPSILRLKRYLRRKSIFNVHRFLVPRTINKDVSRALNKWIRKFNEEPWAYTN